MSTDDVSSFGPMLRRFRKIAELTQEELAERAHLSVRGISDLERGARHSPRLDTLALLVDALELVGAARAEFEAAARSADVPVSSQPSTTMQSQFGQPSGAPLVGRIHERAALERHLAGSGPPVFLLAGEPGIGKTRLLTEAAEYAGRAGFRVLVGRSHRHGDQMPYAPLLEALQSYLRDQSTARLRSDLHGCSWLVRLLPELSRWGRSNPCRSGCCRRIKSDAKWVRPWSAFWPTSLGPPGRSWCSTICSGPARTHSPCSPP